MSRLEQNLVLPRSLQRQYRDLSHSVPFGAHSFIENKAEEHGIYYSSSLHSNFNQVPLMRRSNNGSARTIKHLTKKQSIANEAKKEDFASQVKYEKQRYKALEQGKETLDRTLAAFKDALKGYYESSSKLQSRRLVIGHAVSLNVAYHSTKTTIEDIQRDTEFLKERENPLHSVTKAVADHFKDTQETLKDLHNYVREKAVKSKGVAADDATRQGNPSYMRGRLDVWSAHLRPTNRDLVEKAHNRSKALDGQKDYRK